MKNKWYTTGIRSSLIACFVLLVHVALLAQQNKPTEIPITTKSEEARQLYVKAMMHLDNLKHQDALKALDQALALDDRFASAHLLRVYVSENDLEAARKHLEKAVSLKNDVSDGEQLLIEYMKSLTDNKPEEAAEALDKLVELYPQDKYALLYRGQEYFNRDETDKAIDYLKKT